MRLFLLLRQRHTIPHQNIHQTLHHLSVTPPLRLNLNHMVIILPEGFPSEGGIIAIHNQVEETTVCLADDSRIVETYHNCFDKETQPAI